MKNNTLLSIAGFDPSSGAGIAADLMVFAAHGLFGTSCITALTVQNTLGVAASHVVATDILIATLNNLYADLPPSGIKIGMLGSSANVLAVAAFLSRIRKIAPVTVVLDPVLKSSSGKDLLDQDGVVNMRRHLIPEVDWITPNTAELAVLTGRTLDQPSDLLTAAKELQHLGRELKVVVTGGHSDPPNDTLLQPGAEAEVFEGKYVSSTSTHGTGCAFSTALLSRLMLGDSPSEATEAAKRYVAGAIHSATPRGSGAGPVDHLWALRRGAI